MSRSNQKMKELTTGVHLVTVLDATPTFDSVIIRFTSGHNKSFDQEYYTSPDKIFALKKLCAVTGVDIRSKEFKAAISGKTLWIAIKEIHSDSDVNHYVFDTIICDNPEQRPIISGDPIQHPKGVPMGVFVERSKENIQRIIDERNKVNTIPEEFKQRPVIPEDNNIFARKLSEIESKEKSKIIADAKEMIKKVEAKEITSLNQPNNAKTVSSPDWDDF